MLAVGGSFREFKVSRPALKEKVFSPCGKEPRRERAKASTKKKRRT